MNLIDIFTTDFTAILLQLAIKFVPLNYISVINNNEMMNHCDNLSATSETLQAEKANTP